MYHSFRFLLSIVFIGFLYSSSAQQLNYSPQESENIHDSIHHSRWDIGGRLSQYSFRYMSEFFPTSIIHKSDSPYQYRTRPLKSITGIVVKKGKDSLYFEDYLKSLHIAGCIVIHKGNIVYEKYFSMLREDKHTLQSVTKVITSAIITSLINEKKIDINQSIDFYIPEFKGTEWQGISIRDILDMRSGMDNKSIDFATGPFTNPQHKNYQLESALGLLPHADNTPASVYTFLTGMKRDTVPGVQAAYSNINTFVLSWLTEKITGKKYADLVTERIWMPMGASSDAYTCISDKGIAWPHGGISATLRDLARFGMLFTNSEIRARKESIISFAQLKEIFDAPAVPNLFAPFKWAYQWDFASDDIMIKGGFGGQMLYVAPEREVVIAYYNYVDKDWDALNLVDDSVIDQVLKAITGPKQ